MIRCQTICPIVLDHEKKGWLSEIKEKLIEMTLNGSGVRDIARVLSVCTETAISEIKKKASTLQSVNKNLYGFWYF